MLKKSQETIQSKTSSPGRMSLCMRDGAPAEYDSLTIVQFIWGFNLVACQAKSPIPTTMYMVLDEIMEDAALYP